MVAKNKAGEVRTTTGTTASTKIIESLRRSQANTLCMYLNAKRYHWFTFGPHFRDLHLLFDELAAANLEQVDPLGERARILGGDPISTPDEIKATATVQIADGKPTPHDMLRQALENERHVIKAMREGARMAEEEDDPGTNDLYSSLIQSHEKYAWFIEEALRSGDGID